MSQDPANTSYGTNALASITTGTANTGIGWQAGKNTTEGSMDTFVGCNAGVSNVDGENLTFVGESAGTLTETGLLDTFIGGSAGANNIDGSYSTLIGGEAGFSSQHGNSLVAVGHAAIRLLNGGNSVTAIGEQAGAELLTGSNNIFIGAGAQPSSSDVSNEATYGNEDIEKNRFFGVMVLNDEEQGVFKTPVFNSSDFTANNSMTWAVQESDVLNYQYETTGKKMTMIFSLANTSVGGTPSTGLFMKLPGGKTIKKIAFNPFYLVNNGVEEIGRIRAQAGNNFIELYRVPSGNWTGSTNGTNVLGQISLEIE